MSKTTNQTRSRWGRRAALAVAVSGAYVGTPAFATNFTWLGTGGNNNWNNPLNWLDDNGDNVVPPNTPPAGDVTNLYFSGTFSSVQTSTQNLGPIDVHQIVLNATFNAATLGIAGSSTGDQFINLGAGGIVGNVPETGSGTVNFTAGLNRKIILTADQEWSNTNTLAIISMRRVVEGDFKITKTGSGTIEFQVANPNWTGGLQLDEGVIRLSGSSDALGPGPLIANTDNDVSLSASGSVNQNIAGPITLGGTGSFGFRGSNTFFLNNSVTLLNDKSLQVSQPAVFNGPISGNFIVTKTSGGTMTLNVANTNAGFVVDGGYLVYGADDRLGVSGAPVGLSGGTLQPGAAIVSTRNINLSESGGFIDGGSNNLSFGNVDGTGTFTQAGSGVLTVNRVRASNLDVAAGSVRIAAGAAAGEPARVSVVNGVTLAGGVAPTTTLDLSNNGLIVDYGEEPPPPGPEAEPFDTIRAQIINAYNGGAWNQPGITSSSANASTHGLGYAESSAVFSTFPATFMGQEVDEDAVLVRYTRYGDANVDGMVNLADFNRLAANFGSTAAVWSQGDFNYDGTVNLADFNRLAASFGLQAGPDGPTPDDWAALASAVPEPGAAALLGMVTTGALLRRRRR